MKLEFGFHQQLYDPSLSRHGAVEQAVAADGDAAETLV